GGSSGTTAAIEAAAADVCEAGAAGGAPPVRRCHSEALRPFPGAPSPAETGPVGSPLGETDTSLRSLPAGGAVLGASPRAAEAIGAVAAATEAAAAIGAVTALSGPAAAPPAGPAAVAA